MSGTYYRGCWHVLSPDFLCRSVKISSLLTGVYNPRAFIHHAALLRQAFAHCGRFSTAATRRCLGSVSVPVRRVTLSRPLPILGLVGHYPTNNLIGRRPLPRRKTLVRRHHPVLPAVSRRYPGPRGTFLRVTLPCAAFQLLMQAKETFSLDLHA